MHLVEREGECRAATELISNVGRGHGGLLVVDGPVGCGKTALLRWTTDRSIEQGVGVLAVTASALERHIPLGTVRQLLDNIDDDASDSESVSELIADMRSLPEIDDDRPLSLTAVPSALVMRIQDVLTSLSRRGPLVLSIDDLHHADSLSLSFFLTLAHRTRDRPMMLVSSHQPACMRHRQALLSELFRQPDCRHVSLRPLTPAGVCSIAGPRLGRTAATKLAAAFADISGGSPLLAHALLTDQDTTATAETLEEDNASRLVGTGPAYQQAIVACLQRGPSDVATTAHALAVLEESGSARLLGLMLRTTSPNAMARHRDVLVRSGILSPDGYRHVAARHAALEHMSPEDVADLHVEAARLLHEEDLQIEAAARHLVAAQAVPEPWGTSVLLEAAEQAEDDDRIGDAEEYMELVLRASTDETRRADATLQLARTVWRRNPSRALNHVLSVTGTFGTAHLDDEQVIVVIKSLLRHGRFKEARSALAQLADHSAGQSSDGISSQLEAFWLWFSCTYPGLDNGLSPAPPRTVRDQHIAFPTDPLLQSTRLLREVVASQGAKPGLTGIEQDLRTHGLSHATLEPLGTAITALIYDEKLDLATEWCHELLDEAARRRAPAWKAALAPAMAEIALRKGDLIGAEAEARLALSYINEEGWEMVAGVPRAVRLVALTHLGDLAAARALLNEPVPDTLFLTRGGLQVQRARGVFHLELGQAEAALQIFWQCGAQAQAWGQDHPGMMPWRSDAVTALLMLGRPDEARTLLEEQFGLLGETHRRIRGISLRLLSATLQPELRTRTLQEAVDALETAGDRYELARALFDLGSAYLGEGDDAAAQRAIRRARQEATAVNATRLLDRMGPVNSQLALAPTTAQDLTGSGLTDSERRIARLVVKGHTNRHIADQLFVTVSTVEQHLTNIYRKLQVRRRSELRRFYQEMPHLKETS